MNKHVIINLLILSVGIYLMLGNRKLKKKIEDDTPWDYLELLVKLKHILETSELEIFKIAAKEKGFPEYRAEEDFSMYLKRNAGFLPQYLKNFLDDGRETIMSVKVNRWVMHGGMW